MQEERRLAVLRAIVEDYVTTEEPVGSKALVERHGLGVSPATVRNDMAALEDEGYITQPHTSAGRVPTDKGYRLFVDRLTTVKPMSAAEKRAIATILDGAVDLDDVVNRSVRLLAQLTRQVAVVQYPTLSRSTVRHVEVVALAPNRLLVVLILSTGRVEQRLVELGHRPRRRGPRRAAHPGQPGRDRRDHRGRRRPRCGRWCPPTAVTPARRRRRDAGRGDVRPPLRRADRGRRRRQPGPLRRQLRLRRTAAARGARGARRAAQAARRGVHRRAAHRPDRPRGPVPGARLDERRRRPATARATRPWPGSASSAPPAWTTPARWRRCAPSPATSRASSTRPEPRPDHDTLKEHS